QGLVRERARGLALSVVEDLGDPFRVVEMTGQTLKADPPRLIDEAAQLSMTGGRRVIWVHEATDAVCSNFQDILEIPGGQNLVIAEAGNLGPRSSLRKLFEKANNAGAIGCYEDGARDLGNIIQETLGRFGLSPTADATAFLIENLGGDRLVTRGELEKLALYVGGGLNEEETAAKTVEVEDAMACIGDSAAMSLDFVVYATASGNAQELDRTLERAYLEGTSPIGVLRAMAGHLQRLHLALGFVAGGQPPDSALDALKPRIIFKFKSQFQAQMRQWRLGRLARAMELLMAAEIECKSTGLPAAQICHRALIRISQAARAKR
ncbi:MAG: DNA polymerase III subunit delta, partial [Rhodospirillales bacterium]